VLFPFPSPAIDRHPPWKLPSPPIDRLQHAEWKQCARARARAQYVYQQLGCSKQAVAKMLNFARTHCVGKPFSNIGMARSLLWPRHTDSNSFFCAGALRI
jgi:hypothetical protein